jgi:hypothetical protein
MYRTEPTCSDERTPHRMDAGSEATSYALSTSPTPWPQPQRSGIARLPSGDSRPKTTSPTTIIAGTLTSNLPTSATSSAYVASHSRLPDRAGAHGLPINGWVSSSGARDGLGS